MTKCGQMFRPLSLLPTPCANFPLELRTLPYFVHVLSKLLKCEVQHNFCIHCMYVILLPIQSFHIDIHNNKDFSLNFAYHGWHSYGTFTTFWHKCLWNYYIALLTSKFSHHSINLLSVPHVVHCNKSGGAWELVLLQHPRWEGKGSICVRCRDGAVFRVSFGSNSAQQNGFINRKCGSGVCLHECFPPMHRMSGE